MKVFTFFYNRYDNATTSKALFENGIKHNVLIHNENDCEKFKLGNTLFGNPIVTNNPKGLGYQRNAALDLMDTGEWAVFMSDDFTRIKSMPDNILNSNLLKLNVTLENQHNYKLKVHNTISLKQMFTHFNKLINLAEKNNIHLIGFGAHDNPMNFRNRFIHRGLADGRFWLVKKSTYKFDLNAQCIDDYYWTAENLIRHNNVLVNTWIIPEFKRYSEGGYGTSEERKKIRIDACKYLAYKYNPLIRIAEKKYHDYGTHIKLFATQSNIDILKKRLLL